MEVTEYIINKLKTTRNENGNILVGVCGRAGSGKTTLSDKIRKELNSKKIDNVAYSGDWRFIFDSKDRKLWIEEKWKAGIDEYLHSINQFRWWDFKKIYDDLDELVRGNKIKINDAYNRLTGKKDFQVEIKGVKNGVILYENAILGGVEILEKLDVVVLLNTSDAMCFERTMKKDSSRRSLTDIAARFIITTYSENFFLNMLLDKFSKKTVICDSNGKFGTPPTINNVSQIPVLIPNKKLESRMRKSGTVFCNLDGTIIKHVPIPSENGNDIEFVKESVEKLKKLRKEGYYLIMTTSRPYSKVFGVLERLKSKDIYFDQIICDLPVGPRYLINDSKMAMKNNR